jgi:maleylpyruvate isomerase
VGEEDENGRHDDDGSAVHDDPGEPQILLLQSRIADATGRLLATAAGLTDRQAREPSPLPGWSRGHVLTHLARNADGLRNLLIWARTGVVTPQYPSQQARDGAIEAGAGRPAAELLADLRDSAAAFRAEVACMPGHGWQVTVNGIRGGGHPAWYTLWRRLSEVEIHHVDLAAGYQAADWPGWFVAERLESVAAQFAQREDAPAAQLRVTGAGAGTGLEYQIGTGAASGGQQPGVRISGPGWLLLAWLTGRSAGAGLAAEPPGPLPVLPAW